MGRKLRDIYWPCSRRDDALFVAGRRAFSAFCVPAGLAGLLLSILNIPYFADYPASISFGFFTSFFCLFAPAFVPRRSEKAFQRGAVALFCAIFLMVSFVYWTSIGPNSVASLFYIPFVMSVTLMIGRRLALIFVVGAIAVYIARAAVHPAEIETMDVIWLRSVALSCVALLVYFVSGSYRSVLIQAAMHLKDARVEADAANRAKSEFLANMSHEIRTPMNGVISMADLLVHSDMAPAQKRQAETICRSGQALLEIINDILDFSKIEAGKLTLESVPMNPAEITEEVGDLLGLAANQKNISLTVQRQGEIGTVSGDPTRLRQVLINLIGNAVKFTEEGGVTVSLIETPKGRTTDLSIVIRDTGVGIPEDKLNAIFSPFAQAETSTTRRYGGTGLGLAITKELVTAMGGTLSVSSVLGKGTCFTLDISLPIVSAETPEISQEVEVPAEETVAACCPGQSRCAVLVAEDNEVNRLVLDTLVDKNRFDVTFAHNGQEAVDLFKAGDFTAVLMDISMPVLDGMEAMQEIRAYQSAKALDPTPIIALTAHALAGDRERLLSAGMDDYLSKPLVKADLLAVLEKWTICRAGSAAKIAAH
ncbi:ATP-binding protein [Parvularcula marina]|uniref:ATP-binding protein n=1 Tax=Parvularcula marina TaxID=2292771 RepID=UPI003519105B